MYKVVENYVVTQRKAIVTQDVQEFWFKRKNLILTFALMM